MNYYEPCQREDTKRWDYTRRNDGHITPIGYCRGWERSQIKLETARMMGPRYVGESVEQMVERENAALLPFKDKYHDDGHDTADEARACYRLYELDHDLKFRVDSPEANSLHKCEAPDCGLFTSGYGEIQNGAQWWLCAAHRNRETVEGLYEGGDAISSY